MQSSHVIALFAQAPAYISGGSAHKVVIGKPLGYHPKEVDGSCERHKPGLKSAKKGLGSSCMYVTLPHITLSPCCLVCTPYHTCMPYMIIVVLARHIATTAGLLKNQAAGKPKGYAARTYTPLNQREAFGNAMDRKNLLRTAAEKTTVCYSHLLLHNIPA